MKHVRCNHCNAEYYICEELSALGFPLGGEQCEVCGETDYLIIDNDVKVEYSNSMGEYKEKDMIGRLTLLRNEIDEIIDEYR
jgi:hypothetical protein